MVTSGPARGGWRATGETWAFAAAALLVHALLRQDALHGTDWRWLVLWLDEPGVVHPQHPAYLPLARALRWLLAPWGTDGQPLLCAWSALGGAVAVAGLHRAALAWGEDRAAARWTVLLVAAAPALFHFATVAELHAPFAGAMAWATWAAVRWWRRPACGAAVRAGALMGAATLLHATGHLMVPCLLLAVGWRLPRPWRERLAQGLLCAFVHAAVWGIGYLAMRTIWRLPAATGGFAAGDPAGADHPAATLWWSLQQARFFAQLGPTAVGEWLLPYAPVSVLAFAAAWRRPQRPAVLLFAAALALYLAATTALVHALTDERGAYLLPLLLPAVLLAQAALPRRGWPLLAAAAVACGFSLRGEPGRLPPDRAFGHAAVAFARAQPATFLVAGFPEMDGAFLADARLDLIVALASYDDLRAARRGDPSAAEILAWLQLLAHERRQRGARLLVTDRAVAWLGERLPAFPAAWREFASQAERLPAATGLAGVVVR